MPVNRRLCVLAAVAMLCVAVTACDAAGVATSSAPGASTDAGPMAATPTPLPTVVRPAGSGLPSPEPGSVGPSDQPTSAPTEPPSDDAPTRPNPAAFLQVCRSADLEAVAPVPCSDVIETALGAPELMGARIDRVQTGGTCDPARACGTADRQPSAWVTVLSDRGPLIVKVALGADGGLSVADVHPAVAPEVPPFSPPDPGRAELPGAPGSLIRRAPYPLCGTEQAPMGGPYDEAARRCFLEGVLAGSPVEFASLTSGTEGGALVSLYRFAGHGGLDLVTGEGATWTRRYTGIADAGGGLVFDIAGMSTAPEPVP